MPLPHFLFLIAAVILAAGLTLWVASQAGVSLALLAVLALVAAGLVRLMARVE
ncbi:hypothetical protein [Phaeovulum veldkampii]|uniref:hypothetical protein n=1 Tax=Phaeovulum veldkampii TaxID=33049 RepID=UPI0010DD8081|nr:hypothetical protein [Phaeovulum veldkampii]TDQ62258.1 hypothetical protein EV658_10395 [Phaeovulum veldkampii DSM 11550]